MAVVSITLHDLIDAIIAKLRADISGTTDLSVYQCMDATECPPPEAQGVSPFPHPIVVAANSGTMPDDYTEGGAEDMLTVDRMTIDVGIHSADQRDQVARLTSKFRDPVNGLCEGLRLVLKSLSNYNPPVGSNVMLSDPLFPTRFSFGSSEKRVGFVVVSFSCSFDFDIEPDQAS